MNESLIAHRLYKLQFFPRKILVRECAMVGMIIPFSVLPLPFILLQFLHPLRFLIRLQGEKYPWMYANTATANWMLRFSLERSEENETFPYMFSSFPFFLFIFLIFSNVFACLPFWTIGEMATTIPWITFQTVECATIAPSIQHILPFPVFHCQLFAAVAIAFSVFFSVFRSTIFQNIPFETRYQKHFGGENETKN